VSTRPPERDDLDALLDAVLPFAQDMITKRGEFFPFGAAMSAAGDVRIVVGYTGSEHPLSQDVIDTLLVGFRADAEAGTLRAAGICFDAKVRGPDGKPTDAIVVALEHRAGDTVRHLAIREAPVRWSAPWQPERSLRRATHLRLGESIWGEP
jgi:hypothetical protein